MTDDATPLSPPPVPSDGDARPADRPPEAAPFDATASSAPAARRRRIRRGLSVMALAALAGVGVALPTVDRADDSGASSVPPPTSAPSTSTSTPALPAANAFDLARPPTPPTGVTPDPTSLVVLVDRERRLPPGWVPPDLVEPAVPFTFAGHLPKRLLRRPAARALELLVADAAGDGVAIAGVSGYRSEETQRGVYDDSVRELGDAVAATSSARPGHSEHQTGLAIDVTGGDGLCPAEPCFAGTAAARWLEANAHRFGFVVRYPRGAELVTGYRHEPWHVRYVGVDTAERLHRGHLTLDELLGAA